MEIYKVAIVLTRLQGFLFLFNLVFNLGYSYQDMYGLFHTYPNGEHSQYQVIIAWLFVARQVLDLFVGFIFLKYDNKVAALLVYGLRKIGEPTIIKRD